MCGAGDDMILGGRGTDQLFGAEGDDIFVLNARDAGHGIERIDGGPGNDVAAFAFPRPRGVRHRAGVTYVPSRGGRFRLKRIERLQFKPHRPTRGARPRRIGGQRR
jgi:hypothetical protein